MIFAQELIAVVILLLGMGMLVYAFFCLSRALGSRSWPTAKGTITRSFVDKDNDDEVTYTAKVTYRFRVGGREFSGNHVQAGGLLSWGLLRGAERVTIKYPVGASVRVRYLPRDPHISLLEPGVNSSIAFYFAGAIGFGVWAWDLIHTLQRSPRTLQRHLHRPSKSWVGRSPRRAASRAHR